MGKRQIQPKILNKGVMIMTVKKLIQELQKYPEDLEVFTKKTEIVGTIGVSSNVYVDTYGFLGADFGCVIISDTSK